MCAVSVRGARAGGPERGGRRHGGAASRALRRVGQRTFTSDDANQWRSVGPFSPDGTKVVGSTSAGQISICNTLTRTFTQLTFQGDNRSQAAWTPDGRAVVFVVYAGAESGLHWMNADGSSRLELLVRTPEAYTPSLSPDGRTLAFQIRDPKNGADLVALQLDSPLRPGIKTTARASAPHNDR